MKVFLDTNILVDCLDLTRRGAELSENVVRYCEEEGFQGVISALSVPNLLYILRKMIRSNEQREIIVFTLCNTYKIVSLERGDLLLATGGDFSDYEDGLQILAAERADVDYIITNDKSGFRGTKLKVLTPKEFLAKFSEQE